MEKYEFSKHSYDKLKQFLELVDNNVPNNENNELEKLFPQDTELLNKLYQHEYTQTEVISIKDGSEEVVLSQKSQETSKTSHVSHDSVNIGNTSYNEIPNLSNQLEVIDDLVVSLKGMLDILQEKLVQDIIMVFENCEPHLEIILGRLKQHPNMLELAKFLVNCEKNFIIQAYCNVVLHTHILLGTESISTYLNDFLEKQPEITCQSLVKTLLAISEENKSTNEFIDGLLTISQRNKVDLLGKFLGHCTQLNAIQMKIVNNLLHNYMDQPLTKNLLDLLSRNAMTLSSDRSFVLLLENLMLKSSKHLYPLQEQVKDVVNLMPKLLKLKFMKRLQSLGLEHKHSDSTLSQTTQY